MKLKVPKSSACDRVQFMLSCNGFKTGANCDNSLDEIEVMLPENVQEQEVYVVAQFLDAGGKPVGEEMVVQEPELKPVPKPETKQANDRQTENPTGGGKSGKDCEVVARVEAESPADKPQTNERL